MHRDTTSSVEERHVRWKLSSVRWRCPNESVTPETGEGVVSLRAETTDHIPVPVTAGLPFKVVIVELHKVWSVPASATIGSAL